MSDSLPSGPQPLPPARIRAGIDASMMTSEGTCKFVIPLSESTIYIGGRDAMQASISATIAALPSTRAIRSPRPELGFTPKFAIASPCFSKTGARNAFTACPKMIGSETFIIVAFMCNENSVPSAFVFSISSARKASKALPLMNVASTTVPAG